MRPKRFNAGLQQALLDLLDDTEPQVQQALLIEFQRHGREAEAFLREIAGGKNRILAYCARWYLDELKYADPVAEFRGYIRSLNTELEAGMLLMSRVARRDVDIAECCEQLDALAGDYRALVAEPASAREKCRVLNRVFFNDAGFRVSLAGEARDFLMDQVLARRKGSPACLGILYLLVARRAGLPLEPVNAGGYFVAGCYADAEPFFVDVIEHGAFRGAPGMRSLLAAQEIAFDAAQLSPVPAREALGLCCRGAARCYGKRGDRDRAQLFAEFAAELEARAPSRQAL